MVLKKLRWHSANLVYILPSDQLFEAKSVVIEFLINNLGTSDEEMSEKLELIRENLNNAFALVKSDSLQAKLALERYYKSISTFINENGSMLENVKYRISQDSQIMDNLLKQYSEFYQDGYFAIKSYLENEWLKLIPEGVERIEEQQTIISTKIDFLKQVQAFFLAQEVSLNDARKIVLRLVNEI